MCEEGEGLEALSQNRSRAPDTTRPDGFLDYGQRLDLDRRWAMDEGDRYFQRENSTFKSLRKFTRRLEELRIPYAVAGYLAMFAHGFRQFTEFVDVLVTPEGLKVIHQELKGHGYWSLFSMSRHLCDAEYGVHVRLLLAGEFPGDGKPKPVAFPEPSQVSVEFEGISYLNLPKLIELKLASGITGGVTRLRDLSDVIALIQALDLPPEFADSLDPYVREKYAELWQGIQDSPRLPDTF